MNTELENRIIKKLDRLETKIDDGLKEVNQKFDTISKEVTEIKMSQTGLARDNAWIKWLFGGLFSFILILLSILITVLFKLVDTM